jgi:nucleoside phosphorylase
MLQRFVAAWLKQQAQEVISQSLHPESQPATDEPAERDIVVIFPNRSEAGGFFDKLTDAKTTRCNGYVEHLGTLGDLSVCVIEAPVSHERLAQITHDVIQLRQPKWVLSSGFVVAVHEDLRKGHLLMAQRVIDAHEYSLQTGLQVTPGDLSPAVHVGTLLTVEVFPVGTNQKEELSRTMHALACDRQAAIVAEVSRLRGARMMAVHAVAESLHEQSRVSIREVKAQDTLAAKIGAAAGAMIEQPSSAKHFWNEKETALRLSDRLAGFLTGVIRQLA